MNSLKRNIIANFLGKGWAALMGLAFIPVYIKLMGIEAYGLVGFFVTLQAVSALLDLGLTTTLNRELARYSALPGKVREMRDLVRTMETIYWALAFFIGVVVVALSHFIASQWIRAGELPTNVVQQAVILMGLVMAFQWPLGFYAGGLLGLQRQVLYNGLNAGWYTFRFAGAAAVLWLVSPTILAFFLWQAFVSALSTVLMALALWRSLPSNHQPPRFQAALLTSVWRFATGIGAISATVVLLTQLDKIILSKLLSLEMFGYYSLAWVVASALSVLVGPVFIALFPNFSRRVELGDTEGLKQLYHRGCQLMSVLILPAAVMVAFFAPEILLLWTRNPITVEHTRTLVRLLVIGTVLNGLMNLPYALQLAHGWTRLTLCTNVVSAIILTPSMIIMTSHYGATGAAVVWVVLNGGYVLFQLQIMHRRLLPGEQTRWYLEDVGLPLAATLVVVAMGRWLIHGQMSPLITLVGLAAVAMAALAAAVLAVPQLRGWAIRGWAISQAEKRRAV